MLCNGITDGREGPSKETKGNSSRIPEEGANSIDDSFDVWKRFSTLCVAYICQLTVKIESATLDSSSSTLGLDIDAAELSSKA